MAVFNLSRRPKGRKAVPGISELPLDKKTARDFKWVTSGQWIRLATRVRQLRRNQRELETGRHETQFPCWTLVARLYWINGSNSRISHALRRQFLSLWTGTRCNPKKFPCLILRCSSLQHLWGRGGRGRGTKSKQNGNPGPRYTGAPSSRLVPRSAGDTTRGTQARIGPLRRPRRLNLNQAAHIVSPGSWPHSQVAVTEGKCRQLVSV